MKGHVSKRPLDLSGCNLHGVRRYTPKNMYQYKMIFIPVCDMTHWWLVVFEVFTSRLYVLCSMGWKNKTVASNIRRYLQHIKEEQQWPDHMGSISEPIYADVARQKNGHDCGVYLLEFARVIIKEGCINSSIENINSEGRRTQLKELLQSL
ncbi:ubiquitin-like-specific protease ESD4 [Xenia sp. Carnegie-2017]|uniref:ubiquitin-like-specific protease ESD4 n=1 Tax=Xenia sp. Carnegie-2017 TaxID=2897299 RepID=UPI001F03E57C|nr:ubiquitin-like-specific protease ESD4 [Xenia sp. Carnegie-2017]